MKILNFGSCNLDYVYSLDHIVAPGETEASQVLRVFPGGKGLNQSIAAARAGVTVYHAGCVGCDGQLLLDTMAESGVDTRYLRQVPEKNGHAIIQVTRDGENSIVLYAGSNAMVTEELIDSVLADFGTGDILLLQNEISNTALIAEKAHEKGMYTVFNPSPFDEKFRAVDLSHISCLILNEVEARGFAGAEPVPEILSFFRAHHPKLDVMLTLGKRGCVFSGEQGELSCPAFPVEAVDTTAAGDTFTGYFIAGLSQNMDRGELLKMASAASAIAVTRPGAAPSIPTAAEVREFLQERKAYH